MYVCKYVCMYVCMYVCKYAGYVSISHIRNRAHSLRLSQKVRIAYLAHIDAFHTTPLGAAAEHDDTLNNIEFGRLFAKMTQQ
jgi:hypothetical protein